MANGTTRASNGNSTIVAGLRADIMRNLMETKNTLITKGSLYVGTGEARQIGPSDDQVTVYDTAELVTGGAANADKLLSVASDGGLLYKYITAESFGDLLSDPATSGTSKVIGLDSNGALNCGYLTAAHFGGTTALRDLIAPYVKLQALNSEGSVSSEFRLYRKTFSNFADLNADRSFTAAVGSGAIIDARLAVVTGTTVINRQTKYYPVMFSLLTTRLSTVISASYFDAETNTWMTLSGNSSGFTPTGTLVVTYLAA